MALLLLVALPVLEIWLIILVGHAIGALDTILLLVATAIVGSWLVRREGTRAWRRLRQALSEGRTPTAELADGALVAVGGLLLIIPGFFTDAIGLLCVLPFTRPLVRIAVLAYAGRRATRGTARWGSGVRIVDVRTHADRPSTRPTQAQRGPSRDHPETDDQGEPPLLGG